MIRDDIKQCMLVAEAEVSKQLLDQTGRHADPHELILRRDPQKNVAMAYRKKEMTVRAQAENDRQRELKMIKAAKKRQAKEEKLKRKEARRAKRAKQGSVKKKKKKKSWSFWGKRKKVDSDGDEMLSSSSSDEDNEDRKNGVDYTGNRQKVMPAPVSRRRMELGALHRRSALSFSR